MNTKMLQSLLILLISINYFAVGQTKWLGDVDAITYDSKRQVYYVFNGSEYSKHKWNRSADAGYPRKIKGNWSGWPTSWGDGSLDAITYDSKRDVYYLFKGDEYVKHKWGGPPMSGYPKKIRGNWSGWPVNWGAGDLSAIAYDSDRDVYYLFKGRYYSKHKWGGTYDRNVYPKTNDGNWSGWVRNFNSTSFDAVTFDNSSRKVYYIFSNEYKMYGKHKWNKPLDAGYPRGVLFNWKGYQADIGRYQYHMIIASAPILFCKKRR